MLKIFFSYVVLLVIITLMQGCNQDSDNYLDGSITDSYDMGFDSVRIRSYPATALSVEYIATGDHGEKIPLRVTIDKDAVDIKTGVEYSFLKDATIARGAGYDSSPLPDLDSGSVTLSEYSVESGSVTKGSFSAVFISSTGSKLNLRGDFSGNLEVVE